MNDSVKRSFRLLNPPYLSTVVVRFKYVNSISVSDVGDVSVYYKGTEYANHSAVISNVDPEAGKNLLKAFEDYVDRYD